MHNIMGSALVPRLTFRLKQTTNTCFYERRKARHILVNVSAEVSKAVITTTLSTKLYTSKIGISLTNIVPAPNVTCLAQARGCSTNIIVSTSRGPFPSGKVGFFSEGKRGLPSRTRRRVRGVLQRSRRLTQPANRGIKFVHRHGRLT